MTSLTDRDTCRYVAMLLANGGDELQRYLDLGGQFSRQEIDLAHDLCRVMPRRGVAVKRMLANVQRVQQQQKGAA